MSKLIALAAAALAAAALTSAALASSPTVVKPATSKYGTVLFDSRGFALYSFTRDAKDHSNCSGACAAKWPPYIVKGHPSGHLLGVVMRADGSHQLTYAGRPLYHYVGDTKAGQILCQGVSNFGGRWLVVTPSGATVK